MHGRFPNVEPAARRREHKHWLCHPHSFHHQCNQAPDHSFLPANSHSIQEKVLSSPSANVLGYRKCQRLALCRKRNKYLYRQPARFLYISFGLVANHPLLALRTCIIITSQEITYPIIIQFFLIFFKKNETFRKRTAEMNWTSILRMLSNVWGTIQLQSFWNIFQTTININPFRSS